MPRYFFHICDGSGVTDDEEGLELPDADAARTEALRGARALMADEIQHGVLTLASFIDVEDEEGRQLFRISFADAVAIRTGG